MITRYCDYCKGLTPHNKAENRKDSPYICEGCGQKNETAKTIKTAT